MRLLDLTRFPPPACFDSRPSVYTLDDGIASRLVRLPAVRDRLQSSIYFAETAAKLQPEWAASAHLRAALAEFVSMGEVQTLDIPSAANFETKHSLNPLVQLMTLLRHFNIHTGTLNLQSHSVSAQWAGTNRQVQTAIVRDLTLASLAAVRDTKHFLPDDLKVMLDWFHVAQCHWGAGYVFRIGAEAFASELADHHHL